MYVSEVKNARCFFDWYMMKYSTLHEVVEVLQYTYVFSSRSIKVVFKVFKEADVSYGKECISTT